MNMRRSLTFTLIVGGILLCGGTSQADQSKSGTQKSGTHSSGAMGSGSGGGSGSTGGSSGSMNQGHESSGKMGQDSSVITPENPGGIVTRGGRGEIPSDSKVDPLSTDQKKSGSGFSGTIDDSPGGAGSSDSTRSSGGKGSSGGMGSSGGAGGSR
ncbi:MAG: hypothetical protein A4E19_14365 [Nitrospira sp. SG-bin1]|nr:MAG: hypothetical protein A4E19_14365 [Nitrospira sp. SG-bin1]